MSEPIDPDQRDKDEGVAVIIPVYNGEKFIRRSLDTVIKQTLPATEIFVVDDGSTDATLTILRDEYPGVTVLPQSRGGPARARNAATQAAQSPLLAFLDADDWWEPEKLERQVAVLREHPKAVLNVTSMRLVLEGGQLIGIVQKAADWQPFPELQWRNPSLPPSSVMVRRAAVEAVGGFDESFKGNEDWHLWVRLHGMGAFCVCTEPLTNYRVSPGGLSGNGDHMFRDFLPMLDLLLGDRTGLDRQLWRRRIVSYQAYSASMTARAAGDAETEWKYMWRSLATWPSPLWMPHRFRAFALTMLRAWRRS